MSENDSPEASSIGYVALVATTAACAMAFQGIPWGLWAIWGLIALIVSPRLWRESANLTPLHWLSMVACFGALTLGVYLLGLATAGHTGEPWGVHGAVLFLIPSAALACVFCLARSIELRLRARGKDRSDKVEPT
jgi:hypothetical protein